jgi:hypothetical protein
MQSNTRTLMPLLRATDNFTTWADKLESTLMLVQPDPLDRYITEEPDPTKDSEVKQDKLCLAMVKLYVHESLSTVIRGCKTAKAAYDALKSKLMHALAIRRQTCHTSIAALRQEGQSIPEYLDMAHALMCEAKDVSQPSLMTMLCTQVITGLRKEYLNALGDNLLSHIESSLKADSSEDEVMTLFTEIEQRIRARCKQYLHSMQEGKEPEEDKAAMYNVQDDKKLPQANSGQPHQKAQPQQKRDRSEDQCHYCGLMGHWKNECPDFKLHRANQQRQRKAERQQMRMQMQHTYRGQMQPFMQGAQTPRGPIQLGPRVNMMGYMPSQHSMGAGFQGHASTLQHASQLSQPQQS